MIIESAKIKKNGKIIFPITNAESVLIINKDNKLVNIKDVIDTKVDEAGNGLIIEGTKISHNFIIEPLETESPRLISYNDTGHITSSSPVLKLTVKVQDEQFDYDGSEKKTLRFGDDFDLDDNKQIKLTWGNGTT